MPTVAQLTRALTVAFLTLRLAVADALQEGVLVVDTAEENTGRLHDNYNNDNDNNDNNGAGHGEEDPCSAYKNCGSCTFSRFQYKHQKSSSSSSAAASSSSSSAAAASRPTCHWCALSSTCYSPSQEPDTFCTDSGDSKSVTYEFDCPLGPLPYPDHPPTFLPNWMGELYQAKLLDHVKLIDLSLPGSHDSLSYDLSLVVSDDGIDNLTQLAKLLHSLGMFQILPGDLEEFFRMQAKTQQLTVTQQLDNGIRFLDIRIMWEQDKKEWYSIHFMQSKRPALEYLQQIRTWLDQHPHEVIVIWLSKHGSTTDTGEEQYPGVTLEQKKQFWDAYCQIFHGLLMQQHTNDNTSIFTNSVADLINKNHRVISYVSDYREFTQASSLALDAALVQNTFDGGDGVFEAADLVQTHIRYFQNATANNAHIHAGQGFTLLAMNTASPSWQVVSAAKHQFLHWLNDNNTEDTDTQHDDNNLLENKLPFKRRGRLRHNPLVVDQRGPWQLLSEALCQLATTVQTRILYWLGQTMETRQLESEELDSDLFDSCSSHIKIPGVDHWCPQNLLDIAQLASFYNQIALEQAFQNSWNMAASPQASAFPNAFYVDSLDYDGTIRVGPQLLDGSERGDMNNNHTLMTKHAKYAFVDTILVYNARVACSRSRMEGNNCSILDIIMERRDRYPLVRWKEPSLGRHDDWPNYSDVTNDRAI
jgi:hypothetical protein